MMGNRRLLLMWHPPLLGMTSGGLQGSALQSGFSYSVNEVVISSLNKRRFADHTCM